MKASSSAIALIAVLLAVGPGYGQDAPGTKIGLVNVSELFRKSEKAIAYRKEINDELAPLMAKADAIRERMHGWDWERHVPGEKLVSHEKELREGCVELDRLSNEADKLVRKKREAQTVELYKEFQIAIQQYARQSGYHVILGYGNAPDLDPMAFPNVDRRMKATDAGTHTLIYAQPGLDVTNQVLERLNRR
jgi:Skp family chaperone for outer membrane proteins